jgi:hypothetical protein
MPKIYIIDVTNRDSVQTSRFLGRTKQIENSSKYVGQISSEKQENIFLT